LIARPSPDHTSADFLESWYGFLLVAGNAYVEAVGLGGTFCASCTSCAPTA
jgi:phage portal protein BeeE